MEKAEEVFPEAHEPLKVPADKTMPGEVFEETSEAPIGPGTIFDPETELKEVLKSSGRERKEKFEEYREKYAYQKEGLAKMQKGLRDAIVDNPDIDKEALSTLAARFENEYGFSFGQSFQAHVVIDACVERRKDLHETLSDFVTERDGRPRIDAAALFEAAFFEKPKGKIEIIVGPLTLHFRCYHSDDFRQMMKISMILGAEKPTEDILSVTKTESQVGYGASIKNCLLTGLDGKITAENLDKLTEEKKKKGLVGEKLSESVREGSAEIFRHEEQHAVQDFLQTMQEFLQREEGTSARYLNGLLFFAESEEDKKTAWRLYLKDTCKIMDARAKDEILAYLIQEAPSGNSAHVLEFLKKAIGRGRAYDYFKYMAPPFEKQLETAFGKERAPKELLAQIFGDDFEKRVNEAVAAVDALLGGDYSEASRIRAKNLLSTVPLRRWPREVGMFLGR